MKSKEDNSFWSREIYISDRQNSVESGRSGRVSTNLAKNHAAPRQLSLFDCLPPEERAYFMPVEDKEKPNGIEYQDRKGKAVYLTNKQAKLVYLLSSEITKQMGDEDIKAKIDSLENGGKSVHVYRPVDTRYLAKLYYGAARERDIDNIVKLLFEIEQIYQSVSYKGKDGNTIRVSAPLIKTDEILEQLTPSEYKTTKRGDYKKAADKMEKRHIVAINVKFSNAFFRRVDKDFAYITPKLFELWGKRGNGTETELWSVLLSELCSLYRGHYLAAIQAESKAKKEKKDVDKAVRDALTYEEYTDTIKTRITTDYSSKKQYRALFNTHLRQVIETLKEYGIITDASVGTRKTEKGYKVSFVFNREFGRSNDIDEFPELEE